MKKILTTATVLLLTISGSIFAFAAEETQSAAAEGCSSWAEKEIAEAIELGFVPEELQSDYTKPVSYTHLDVYKRQDVDTAGGKIIIALNIINDEKQKTLVNSTDVCYKANQILTNINH